MDTHSSLSMMQSAQRNSVPLTNGLGIALTAQLFFQLGIVLTFWFSKWVYWSVVKREHQGWWIFFRLSCFSKFWVDTLNKSPILTLSINPSGKRPQLNSAIRIGIGHLIAFLLRKSSPYPKSLSRLRMAKRRASPTHWWGILSTLSTTAVSMGRIISGILLWDNPTRRMWMQRITLIDLQGMI